jgi:Peptidase C13 family
LFRETLFNNHTAPLAVFVGRELGVAMSGDGRYSSHWHQFIRECHTRDFSTSSLWPRFNRIAIKTSAIGLKARQTASAPTTQILSGGVWAGLVGRRRWLRLRFVMTFDSLVRWLTVPLVAFFLTFSSMFAAEHAAAKDLRKVTVVSFGLFGHQGVFRREATSAAQIVANRFGGGPVVVKFNSKTGGGATVESLPATLQAEAKKMDAESDILFLILTSHGTRDGLVVSAGRTVETLTPPNLAEMLHRTGVRHKVVIISACYSGVFIPLIADADTLVVTAADANHASFGCEDKAKWTYFGDAFFNVALRRSTSLKDAFLLARSVVVKRELRQGFEPSRPQMAGGENVEPLLVARP